MVDKWFITVGSIARSRIYGCSSEPGGEIGVMGLWQQMVNATGWLMHFLKEISTEFVTSVGKRLKSGIVECRPLYHPLVQHTALSPLPCSSLLPLQYFLAKISDQVQHKLYHNFIVILQYWTNCFDWICISFSVSCHRRLHLGYKCYWVSESCQETNQQTKSKHSLLDWGNSQ